MATIKAPYNFVPFNKKVVSPHWIEQISHDIPFADGLSGAIELTMKAESPIFVRDGIGQASAKKNYENDAQQNPHTFSQFGGRYFIPGTSIKGMIRNVLEILSFGRMEDKVNDHKYALRDLSGAMKDQYLKDFTPDKIYCGWLKKGQDNDYIITDCGIPGRIGHDEIDRYFKTNFVSYFGLGGAFKGNNDKDKAAQKKYQMFGATNQNQQKFAETSFPEGIMDGGRKLYKIQSNGVKEGTLVFSGQPGVRKQDRSGKWTGHFYEFIFFKGDEKELPVPEKVMKDFFFAYYEHDKPKWSEDWKIWRVKLEKSESIPVFFHKDDKGHVKSLGLSYLYKLPYNYSVIEAITNHQGKGKPDLSEAIFGHVDKNNALKGRVHIGHAFASEGAEPDEDKREVLSGPKASYYPNYMRQDVSRGGAVAQYKTFMDKDAMIAGWKRYPVHANGVKHNPPPAGTNSEKILTKFIPLKAGAEFTFSIRYHNLRPVELGALLSALTFHDTENTYHSIGMAKPLGYGKVKLKITNANDLDIPKYLGIFETYMNAQLNKTTPAWHEEEQVTELVTMAQGHNNADLAYMKLDDHVLAKNDKFKDRTPKPKEGLAKYSVLVGNKAAVPSYCDANAIAFMKRAYGEEVKSYLHEDNVEEVVNLTLNAAKKEIAEQWAAKKAQLISQLKAKQAAIVEKETADKEAAEAKKRAEDKAKRQAESQQQGLDLSGINASGRNAFEDLKKTVEKYARDYHSLNDKQLKANFPDGYLPEQGHQTVLVKVKEIYESGKGPKKEVIIKKLAEWIGEEKTKEVTFK